MELAPPALPKTQVESGDRVLLRLLDAQLESVRKEILHRSQFSTRLRSTYGKAPSPEVLKVLDIESMLLLRMIKQLYQPVLAQHLTLLDRLARQHAIPDSEISKRLLEVEAHAQFIGLEQLVRQTGGLRRVHLILSVQRALERLKASKSEKALVHLIELMILVQHFGYEGEKGLEGAQSYLEGALGIRV